MSTVVAIVEGDGEVRALPILLRRLNAWKTPDTYVRVLEPIRVRRDRFLNRDEEFRRHLLLAASKCGNEGWILILLDADDECPAQLAPRIKERADACIPHRRVSVVLANREYEAWFIAAARSLDGQRGFVFGAEDVINPEIPRNAKGWIGERMTSGAYRETTDQAAFSATMDVQQAFDGSRSFQKLTNEWLRQVAQAAVRR